MIKSLIKKLIPKRTLFWYHKTLAKLAAWVYRNPSDDLIVIGITGTNGKTTTSYYIARILEAAGFKVGLITTAFFKIGKKEWLNNTKQTMPGRFRLQRMLKQMVRSDCKYAVIETSSEGIAQHRASHISYDIAVFTNLTPEHIESHGSFEDYKKAKGELFANLTKSPNKQMFDREYSRPVQKTAIVNLADSAAQYFLSFPADAKMTYIANNQVDGSQIVKPTIVGKKIAQSNNSITFKAKLVGKATDITLQTIGEFNIDNALAAMVCGYSQGVEIDIKKKALENITIVAGRLEAIDLGQSFSVFVDYAHEPASLEKVYQSIAKLSPKRIISILGAAGGGRDKGKRKTLGELAARYTDLVIVTNEDPYDEDPKIIIDQVMEGVVEAGKKQNENCFAILDRGKAIKKAINEARDGDVIIITGKGSEQSMVVKNNKKIPWDDREEISKILRHKLAKS